MRRQHWLAIGFMSLGLALVPATALTQDEANCQKECDEAKHECMEACASEDEGCQAACEEEAEKCGEECAEH